MSLRFASASMICINEPDGVRFRKAVDQAARKVTIEKGAPL